MKFFLKKIVSLGLWNELDIQFAKTLTASIFKYKECNIQNIKKTALIFASAHLSSHVRSGHSCLPLSQLAVDKLLKDHQDTELTCTEIQKIKNLSAEDWTEILLSLSAVSDGSSISPLVLNNQCLYLYRMWQDECTVANFFNKKNDCLIPVQKKKIIDILNKLFPKIEKKPNWHKIATALSLIHSRILISGGPGTGKTTTIAQIITALLLYNNNLHIKMITPTGRSASILTHACCNISNNLKKIDYSITYKVKLKATTIHNFLGLQLYKKKKQNYSQNLELDYLIIDESSMISLSMLAQLILSLPKQIKIIFSGDQNQLYSIAPGSIFKEICQFSNFYYSLKRQKEIIELTNCLLPIIQNSNIYNNIADGICILKKNYRFHKNSKIQKLASNVNLGDYKKSLNILHSKKNSEISYINIKNAKDYMNMIINCSIEYCQYLKNIQYKKKFKKNTLETFDNYRILCALRHGPFGVNTLNYYIEHILNDKGLIKLNHSRNYIGRPIIILQNNPEMELYNGDIGILFPNAQNGLSAYFLSSKNEIKIISIHQLPIHETCFAMTIHKAQGSSFQYISIILPNKHTSILTRELLYTAITRTRQQLILYSTDEVLIRTINLSTQRYSGLFNRIYQESR